CARHSVGAAGDYW
nr:immunoglobulin heavy chain junction region [Macaca mulatta]